MKLCRRDFLLASAANLALIGPGTARSQDGTGSSSPANSPVVRVSEGQARGYLDGKVAVFKGLRYGAPVAGKSRFRPASPPPAWTGIRDFHSWGESAPQTSNHSAQIGQPAPAPGPWKPSIEPDAQGEDCLRLNIWTPAVDRGASLPVMVWIHGGGFRIGSGSVNLTEGLNLAASRNVVMVTLNHRLGLFGYMMLDHLDPSYADSGNVGMLDIVQALRWIQANIREFGGDPDRVTIFGESGGGAKVCALLAMPVAKGLFSSAISQSGGMVWGVEPQMAQLAADAVLGKLGVTKDNLDALETLPTDAFLKAGEEWARKFAPVIGGSLPNHPFADGAPSVSRDVPFIIGTSRDESTVLVGSPAAFELNWDALPAILAKVLSIDPEALVANYRALYPSYSPSDIYFSVMSEYLIIRSSVHVAKARAAQEGARTWAYSLEWRAPVMGKFGVPHGLSVPLAFGTIDQALPADAGLLAVSSLMGDLWTSFAAKGAPSSAKISWPQYSTAAHETLAIGVEPTIVPGLRDAERQVMASVPWFDITGGQRAAPTPPVSEE